jgi:hypothetical protein
LTFAIFDNIYIELDLNGNIRQIQIQIGANCWIPPQKTAKKADRTKIQGKEEKINGQLCKINEILGEKRGITDLILGNTVLLGIGDGEEKGTSNGNDPILGQNWQNKLEIFWVGLTMKNIGPNRWSPSNK